MNLISTLALVIAAIVSTTAYSGGAPPETCDDMTPQHHVEEQASKFPYTIKLSKPSVASGESLDIKISGGKALKGFLMQVRDKQNKAVGSFNIPDDNIFAKAVTCHGNKNSAATHKNSLNKNNLTLEWIAPQVKGPLTLYATVAENGGVFWKQRKVAEITVL